MTDLLAGKDALVLGDGEVGAAIARGLARLGASVARHVAETSGRVDLVVIPVTDPGGLTPAPLADMDEAEWILVAARRRLARCAWPCRRRMPS